MRTSRFVPTIALSLTMAGCTSFQKASDPEGTDESRAEGVSEIEAAAGVISPLLPPPFNWILPLAGSLAVVLATGLAGRPQDNPPPPT